jgi:hypothetical protein
LAPAFRFTGEQAAFDFGAVRVLVVVVVFHFNFLWPFGVMPRTISLAFVKCSMVHVKICTSAQKYFQKGDFYVEFGGN